jgi:hypothetical protein
MDPSDRSSRRHGNVSVTVIQAGDNGPFGLIVSPQTEPTWDTTFTSLEQAKAESDRRFQMSGHVCGQGCSDWVDSN